MDDFIVDPDPEISEVVNRRFWEMVELVSLEHVPLTTDHVDNRWM